MLKQRKWRLKQMKQESNDKSRNQEDPINHNQPNPEHHSMDMIRGFWGKGPIPQDGQTPWYSSPVAFLEEMFAMVSQVRQLTEKDKVFVEYVRRRTYEIDQAKGHEEGFAFITAFVFVQEYEVVSNTLKTHLFNVGLVHQIDAYIKGIQFYCCDITGDRACCIHGIKALLLYLAWLFQGRIETTVPYYNYHYNFVWNGDCQCLLVQYFGFQDMPKIFSPIDQSVFPNWSKVNEETITHVTHNFFIEFNQDNPILLALCSYFDEILDYAILNDLLNDFQNQDGEE
jgi:hypothetical protein